MAITYRTVTGNIGRLLGLDLPVDDSLTIRVRTNLLTGTAPIDKANNRFLVGQDYVKPDTNGDFTIANLIDYASADVNPTGIQYYFDLRYTDPVTRGAGKISLGPYSITANGDLSDIVSAQYVPPNFQSDFMDQANAILAQQEELSGIDSSDSAQAYNIDNGPLTKARLTASTAPNRIPAYALAAGPRSGVFDPATGLYVPNSVTAPLRQWRKCVAKARAGVRTAKLVVLGDSIVFGQYATPSAFQAGQVAALRKLVDAALGKSAGTGVIWAWISFNGTAWRNDDTRVTYAGVADTFGYGPFKESALTMATGATSDFTPGVPTAGFRVYYIKQAGTAPANSLRAAIDGDAPALHSTGGGTQNSVGVLELPAADASAPHVLHLEGPNGYQWYQVGVEAVANPGYGIAVTGVGAPGLPLAYYNAPSADGAAAHEFVTEGIDPDLTIIGSGHNEYLNPGSNSLADQYAALTATVTIAQAAGSEVLLMTMVPNGSTVTPSQDDINALRYRVAEERGCVVLDLANRWGSRAADPSIYNDLTHPNTPGYQDIASMIFDVIV